MARDERDVISIFQSLREAVTQGVQRAEALRESGVIGLEFSVRVTPKASRNAVKFDGDTIRVAVTATPEDGKANAAVQKLLAKTIGIAKSRLVLLRGHTSRVKTFRIE